MWPQAFVSNREAKRQKTFASLSGSINRTKRKKITKISMLLQPLLYGRTKSMVRDKIAVFKLHICHW